ncbi:ABC transporter permease [Vineibacter terrae]|uniref:ABC transporter permease n=1 Tax=Vineibacter terrae TaxID=2586908 RepID=UPI002E3288D0|nr:ABC transporter permease [Vineibacter terrae]HEX2890669.1 ABC transporter permease [Vineibacter terrae]
MDYVLQRLLHGVLTLLAVTIVVFLLSRLSGDPLSLILDPAATAADRAVELARLGLDRSYLDQYLIFLGNALGGDFGESIFYKAPAFSVFMQHLPATLELGVVAIAVSAAIAIPAGVLSAVHKGGVLDSAAKAFALTGQSAPIFWIALMLVLVFSVVLGWLPTSGRGGLSHLVLPALTLGWYSNAFLMRVTRSSMLDVLDADYIRLARLEGLPERRIVWVHALKNAAGTIVTTLGLMTISLVTGAVVTETVFAWPGVGRLIVESIFHRDFPVVQAAVTVIAAIVILINLAVDLIFAWIDPRVRLG